MFGTIAFVSLRRSPVSRRDRPAKPPLSRDGVVAAALRIMRRDGLERVTMRRVASELDTGPASLYVYVGNMAELHGALLDELLGDIDLSRPSRAGSARETLVDLLCDYTDLLMGHPGLARSALALWPSGPNYLRLIDRVLGLLSVDGVAARQAAWGVDLLLQHATATAAEQSARGGSVDAESAGYRLVTAIEEAPQEDYPNIGPLRVELFSGTGQRRLRWQFAALIHGIAAERTS
jgi:AcrR family transcriptional regulator